jgi:hypothetical protein
MRMNIEVSGTSLAKPTVMERFLALLLEHPERFARSEVPCALQGLWELANDGECDMQIHLPNRHSGLSTRRDDLQPGTTLQLHD